MSITRRKMYALIFAGLAIYFGALIAVGELGPYPNFAQRVCYYIAAYAVGLCCFALGRFGR